MVHPSDNLQTQEATFKYGLCTYLRGLDRVDGRLPNAPDIEGKRYDVTNTYVLDTVREFDQYPTVVFSWVMYVGIAVVKY